MFPPIHGFPKDVSIKHFEKRIDWEHVRNIPLFFWHAPRDLKKFEKQEKYQKNTTIQKNMNQGDVINHTQFGFKKQALSNLSTKTTVLRPRALIYNTALSFNEERYQHIKNKRRPVKIDKIYSGECDFPFRLKIIGADNIQEIFRHYENECYYNGRQVPNYVSHHPWKEDQEQSMNRMSDKFNKIGKDIRTMKLKKPSKNHHIDNEAQPKEEVVDEKEEQEISKIK